MSTGDGLPPFSSGGSTAGSGGVNVPNPIHLPPVAGVPPGPAPTEQARAFASAGTLVRANEAAAVVQTSLVSAAGKYIPVPYGNCRWSGLCYFFETHPTTGAMVIGLLLGEGEIGGVLEVEVNNAPLRAGCSYTAYTGTASQAVDPTIAALLAARVPAETYTETLAGLAHVVISLGATAYAPTEIRGVDVTHQGKKVFDPRDADAQVKTDPSTWTYSANPGLVLADFISSGYAIARGVVPRYGRRCNVNDAGVVAVANLNDQWIGNAPNLRRRSELHAVLLTPAANETWEQAMRTHARCFVDRLGDTVDLIPDVARAPVASYDANQVIKYERVGERLVGAAPTMMEATFTDTSVKPWRQRTVRLYDPRVLTGDIPEVPGQVDLRMCQSYTQVQGLLRFRLNQTALSVRSWGISLGAEGYWRQKSDVVSVTHPIGMTAKQWVVDTATDRGFGEVHLKLSEYDAGAYADYFQPNPSTLGNGLSTCTGSPALSVLSATQQSQMELQTGGGYACILRGLLSWTASSYPCLAYYEVQVLSGATLVDSALVGINSYTTAPLATGTYTVKVRVVSGVPGQAPGSWASATLTIAAATCSPVPPQLVWEYGFHSRANSGYPGYVLYDDFERHIQCSAPLTTVTRTELWVAWGAGATFATATKVRDDAGAITAWTFKRGHNGTVGYCTLSASNAATIYFGTGAPSPGASPSGTYTDALSYYGGPGGEWFPPDKVWVRFVNGTAASVPVELRLAQTQLVFGTLGMGGYLFAGSQAVSQGVSANVALTTNYAGQYDNFAALAGNLTYSRTVGAPNHHVTGLLFDTNGDLISGYVMWQGWKV